MNARFMDLTLDDPFSNLAAEEAIFRLNSLPTLRVWDNQLSVVIGRAQLALYETDLEFCDTHAVPIIRRFTAGGSVYNGPGNLNWSFLAPRSSEHARIRYVNEPGSVFSTFAALVVEALAACSVECKFVPPNRLETEEGKVSGMAAYLSKERIICHGTLLLDADLEQVARLTTPSASNPATRYPRSNSMRVANTRVGRDELVNSLRKIAEAESDHRAMTPEEEELTRALRTRYVQTQWNLGDPFRLDNP